METELALATAHKWPLATRPHLGVEGASREEVEENSSQEAGKQVQLHNAMGMGIDTREWIWKVNLAASLAHTTYIPCIACVHNHTHKYMCTCAQKHLLPHAYPPTNSHTRTHVHAYTHTHTHTTHLGAVPHCVGRTPQQMGQGTSDLEDMVQEEPISLEGELSQEERES